MRSTVGLMVCLVIAFLPGLVGSRFQPGSWYEALVKPALTPPGWVFPLAWSLLYALMGVALYVAWRAGAGAVPLTLFVIQLVLNGAWSWLFFGLERPGLALVEVALLWLVILATVVAFWRVRPLAGALLLPDLGWVGFASWLNLGILRLNS